MAASLIKMAINQFNYGGYYRRKFKRAVASHFTNAIYDNEVKLSISS